MSRILEAYKQLKSRRVIRAGVIYLAVFWLLLQVADVVSETDLLGEELVRWLIIGGLILFPVVLLVSWYFEHPWHDRELMSMTGDLALLIAVAVAAGLLAWQQWNKSFERPVVAVLLFEPTDIQPGTKEMAHHLAQRFRMLLASAPELRVLETESSWHASIATSPIADKASELNADYLLTATVNQTRQNIRMTVQLFDAAGRLLWSDRFRDRVIDQFQLQNDAISAVALQLGLSEGELLNLRKILQTCEYPAERDLIFEQASIAYRLAGWDGMSSDELEQLVAMIDQRVEGLNEAGLFHLLRAAARLALLQIAEPASKSVLQELTRQDLEDARFLCPALPEIELLTLLSTRRLEADDLDIDGVIRRHPNSAALFSRLANISLARGDDESAQGYKREACNLNPLSDAGYCSKSDR